MSSLYVQTLCAVAGLHLVDQAIQASTNRYSIGVIQCYEQVGVFLSTNLLDMDCLFPKAPNQAHDFAGVLESALYFADSAVVTSRHDFFRAAGFLQEMAEPPATTAPPTPTRTLIITRTISQPTTLPHLPALAQQGEDSSSDCISLQENYAAPG